VDINVPRYLLHAQPESRIVREENGIQNLLEDLSLTKLLLLPLPDELGEHSNLLEIVSDSDEILQVGDEDKRGEKISKRST